MRWSIGRLPVIYQGEHAECGLACIAMVAGYFGHSIDLPTLRSRAGASPRGTSLRDLLRIAGVMDLRTRVVRVEPEQLRRLKLPAIVHWDMSHYVVVKRVRRDGIDIHDPNHGFRRVPLAETGRHLTGIAIELAPGPGFVPRNEYRRLAARDLIGPGFSLASSMAPVLCLAVAAQMLAVASPYFLQLAIDRAIPAYDPGLLGGITLLFLSLAGVEWLVRYARNRAALNVGMTLSVHLSERLMLRLLHMPLSFFEGRSVSGIAAKFDSLDEVKGVVCEDAVKLLVDGLMCVAMCVVLLIYHYKLALLAMASVALYLAYQLLCYRKLRLANEEQIVLNVQQRDHLVQSVRNVAAMKAGAAERQRMQEWKLLFRRAVTGDQAIRIARSNFETSRDSLAGIDALVIGYLALMMVLDGSMTLGMLIAFLTYKRLFTISAMGLVEVSFRVRAVRIHLDNLIDLVPQPDASELAQHHSPSGLDFSQPIHLRNVTFGYPGSDQAVLQSLTLSIMPGKRNVIHGPSGVGKSTLLKLLLRITEPQQGSLWLGSTDLSGISREAWLSHIGVVLQGDGLFSGSIRENIAFGSKSIEDEKVREAARSACIDEEILALPMGYETPLGDRGGGLSGGQIQRLLIARALYRRPRLLIMDEGTANLDSVTEAKILGRIRSMGMTVVHAAHRQQVIDDADTVIAIGGLTPTQVSQEQVTA